MASVQAHALLLAALRKDNADLAEHPEVYVDTVVRMLVETLERGQATAKRVRSLSFNLARNQTLRARLLSGAILPSALCALDAADWASAGVKREREAAAERSQARMRIAATGGELYSQTRSVRCPECGGNRARFKHIGTDMKDWHGRKNEIWGTKHDDDDDGNDCEIICSACDHSWHGAAPEEFVEEETGGASGDDLEQPRRKDSISLVRGRTSVHCRSP